MTAATVERIVRGRPDAEPGWLRLTLDREEWWWWTRCVGLSVLEAQERLGFSDKRAARYERHLARHPLTLETYLARPIHRWTSQHGQPVRRVSCRGLGSGVGN